MRTLSTLAAVLVSTFGFVQLASADANNPLTVAASVAASCTIAGGSLDFGPYNTVSGAAVLANTTIAVACTTGTVTTVTLGQGSHANTGSTATVPLRRMANGAVTSYLAYSLYSDSGTTIWGDTVGTGKGYTASTSASANLTVYGQIEVNQDVPAGAFTDSVVATIAF